MESPDSQKELPVVECPSCGQKVLTGANFCHDCGRLLPPAASEGRKQLSCSTCGQHLLPEAAYCHSCGQSVADDSAAAEGQEPDFSQRVACSDGMCIGIIGPDGRCTECGKPYDSSAAHVHEHEEN